MTVLSTRWRFFSWNLSEASETRFSRRAKRALRTAPTNSPRPQLSNNVDHSKIHSQTPELWAFKVSSERSERNEQNAFYKARAKPAFKSAPPPPTNSQATIVKQQLPSSFHHLSSSSKLVQTPWRLQYQASRADRWRKPSERDSSSNFFHLHKTSLSNSGWHVRATVSGRDSNFVRLGELMILSF